MDSLGERVPLMGLWPFVVSAPTKVSVSLGVKCNVVCAQRSKLHTQVPEVCSAGFQPLPQDTARHETMQPEAQNRHYST